MRPVTVIMPAHDEAARIAASLHRVLRQSFTGRLRVVVVANQCKDDTRAVARSMISEARGLKRELIVEDTPKPGKPHALNLGDALALRGVRIYADADVRISENAVEEIEQALRPETGILLCTPSRKIERLRSRWSRSYARVWSSLPNVRDGAGSGVYAVNEEGRRRWDRFPPIHSDDKFVRLLFKPREQAVLRAATVEHSLPDGFGALLRARVRWCRGNRELLARVPEMSAANRRRYNGLLRSLLGSPRLWPDVPAFGIVFASAAIAAKMLPLNELDHWEHPASETRDWAAS